MKRSEVNAALVWAKELFKKYCITLPEYAYWDVETWKQHIDEIGTIKQVMLGWDITDYGLDRFPEIGGVLYTVRNGDSRNPDDITYCEKYILLTEGQYLPCHYHVFKTEDIINRAGGVLELFLWNTDEAGNKLDTDVNVSIDGIIRTFKPGEAIYVQPGNSIRLEPHMAHIFGAKKGAGDLIVGEVSKVNDDNTDNYFLDKLPRFGDIVEDEAPIHPLCNEYERVVG